MADNFDNFLVIEGATLKDALIKMTSSHRGILVVADSDYNLLGVLSDGDVRRALLDDVSLKIPVSKIMNLNPVVASDKKEAFGILDENPFYIVVPVLDSDGKISGIVSNLNGNNYYERIPEERDPETVEAESKTDVLAIIPARGGSKRIPKKNLAKIGGHSLLSLAIRSALESEYIDEIRVSTDDREIIEEAESHGINVLQKRPEHLSGDEAKTVDVIIHEVKLFYHEHKYYPEYVVLLEPTAPLRTVKLLDEAIEYFLTHQIADSLVSVNKIRHIYHPEELLKVRDVEYLTPYLENRDFDNRKLRVDQKDLFVQNGLIYIVKTSVLLEQKSIYGSRVLKFETPEYLFADIDEVGDLEVAKLKYSKLFTANES